MCYNGCIWPGARPAARVSPFRAKKKKGDEDVKETKERKPYEKPAVVFEKDLEALAGFCGDGPDSPFLGGQNCKASGQCAVALS